MPPTYSIVIPAYNEEPRLAATLDSVLAYVHAQTWDAEVLVVNDGSRDRTLEIVQTFAAKDPVLRLVQNPGNRGKGFSVRNGMLHARGRIVLFTDADLSSPIEEAPKLFNALDEGADIAIGSRWLALRNANSPAAPAPPALRTHLQRAAAPHARPSVRRHAMRIQSLQAPAVDAIFPLQKIERWGFDPEISLPRP